MKSQTEGKGIKELIDLAIDVIQTYGYENKFGYTDGGYSTQETCFSILKEFGVIKNRNIVRYSEIKKYYKVNHPTHH
jgi:hypothetical protein